MKKPFCLLFSMVTFLLCSSYGAEDDEGGSVEVLNPLNHASSKTEELLDRILNLPALSYLNQTFLEADRALGGLKYVSFPPDDFCYFEYNRLNEVWFTYDSEASACWYAMYGHSSSAQQDVPLRRVYAQMRPDDRIDSVWFLLDRLPFRFRAFAPDKKVTGKVLENGSLGGKLYSFYYKGRMFELHTEQSGRISRDCLVVITI